jgi:hypothetical protein
MQFIKDQPITFGEVRKAGLDNDLAAALMGKFAVDDAGQHYSPEAWQEVIDGIDYPDGFIALWKSFQEQTLIPTPRRAAT